MSRKSASELESTSVGVGGMVGTIAGDLLVSISELSSCKLVETGLSESSVTGVFHFLMASWLAKSIVEVMTGGGPMFVGKNSSRLVMIGK